MKKLFVQTYGCQMNSRDAEEVTGLLLEKGFTLAESDKDADVILYETCSVREHAEDKVWSSLGTLKHRKKEQPELVIGVMGCMAKAQRDVIFKRAPHVDFISGPAQLYEVPELIDAILEERRPMKAIQEKRRSEFQTIAYHSGKVSALVTIMEGCDKVCSYCIIPYTRGPEVSRPPEQVVEEVRRLAGAGYKEVMLLGQNVNSYGKRLTPATGFPELLAKVNEVPGIERIRFITSHPWDAVEEMFTAMRDLPKVCEHLHLPVQSGSDPILEKMRRGYSADKYLATLEQLRRTVPGVAVTTDIIIGFPGETEADHEATLRLLEKARFDSAFIFNYSPRPFAASNRWADDVPQAVKDRRLQSALQLQEKISSETDRPYVGQTVQILVEEPGMGRARMNRKAYFDSDAAPGELVNIRVESIRGHSLIGKVAGLLLAVLALAAPASAADDSAALQADFLRGEYREVVSRTRQLLDSDARNRDELLYLQGVSALKLGQAEQGRAALLKLLDDHPQSKWAPQAKAALAQAAEGPAQQEPFSVQVGAFGERENADRLRRELKRKGYDADISEGVAQGRRLFRVRVGRYAARGEAEREMDRLQGDGFPGKVVP